jgi:hypothetical protein
VNPHTFENFTPSISRGNLDVDIVKDDPNAEDVDALVSKLQFTSSGDIRGPTTFADPDCTSLEA